MSKILESAMVVGAITPVNLATGANNGDWVSLQNYRTLVVLLYKGAGTAGEDPVITLKQATDATGSGSKALAFERIYKKVGVQTALAAFTRVDQPAANTYVDDVSAEAEGLFAIEIRAEQLDVDAGFTHVQLLVPKVGAGAQLGCGIYLLFDPRHQGADMPSAIS